jgi:valyl-tRNA synthetase
VKVFVDLYNEGLIYRDKRLVNWDPRLKTAISDLEVETREIKGHFWHFRYPLADGVTLADGRDHLVVATTRPETMLADMAVAVNASDERYHSVIGKFVTLPITGRRIPIIADDHADPELGSGAVKITPGHDFNDFEVGKRAGFKASEMLNMFDAEANVVQVADGLIPERFVGLHRFKDGRDATDGAREIVVAEMKSLGHLVLHEIKGKDGEVTLADAEDRTIQTPYGDRGGVVIEPWLTDQWYVNAAELAKAPMAAVRSGAIEIVPKTWEKTFFNWMENIQPWCVSRQLWWGHRIPAWYGDEGKVYVAETEDAAQAIAGSGVSLARDEDVLDTWFSSALWPFATLGWPDDAELVRRHYPNDLLISGFDILFFWDARMAMQGMKFMSEGGRRPPEESVPWKRLYLHGLVRAADGQKMSKSKGNVVDPLLLIDKFGADALRFFMAAMESQGRDVKMDERRVEGYRNFATKLWNAARFCQSNGISGGIGDQTGPGISPELAVNKWIIGEVVTTLAELDKAMADLRFDAAANAIYHFVWDTFCDWYIELIKGSFDDETRAVAGWVLDQILVMLHPFMPFVTEELWASMGERENELIVAKWPEPGAAVDVPAKAEVDLTIKIIDGIRSQRLDVGFKASDIVPVSVLASSASALEIANRNVAAIRRIARVHPALIGITKGSGPDSWGVELRDTFTVNEVETTSFVAAQFPVGEITFLGFTQGFIDVAAEKARLTKALEASTKEARSLEGRLKNPAFVEKAKPEAVEKARADHAAHAAEAERLAAALARLG